MNEFTNNNKHTLRGTIKAIFEPEVINEKFTKQDFVLVTDEKFQQEVIFTTIGGLTDFIKTLGEGESGTVHFNIGGKEGSNGRYWVNLKAWKFVRDN